MIFCGSQTQVVPFVPQLLHPVLVGNCPDESVECRVFRRWRVLTLGLHRDEAFLFAIEAETRSFQTLGRSRHAIEEEREEGLSKPHERIITRVKTDLDVQPGDVLASSCVDDVLGFALLFQYSLGHLCAVGHGFGQAGVLGTLQTNALATAKAY